MSLGRTAVILLTLSSPGVLMSAKDANPAKPVVEYSQMERSQVPQAFKWRIEDLFADQAAWEKELVDVKRRIEALSSLAKNWTRSPKAMADLLEFVDEVQRRGEKLAAYAHLQGDMDLADSTFKTMNGQVQDLFVGFGAQLAFMDPDVLKLGKAKISAYLKAEPRLAPFRFGLEKTLRAKAHVLPEGEERVATMTGLFADATSNASGMLNNVDMPRPEVILSDGTKVLLNTSNYQRYRASKNAEDRRKVMEAYWTDQKRFENTFAALMDGAMKQHLFDAKVHKFPTCLEASLFSNDIDPAVYRNLIATVRTNLGPLHRLLKLRQRMLGLPEYRYADVYASAVSAVDKSYTFDEAKRLVLDATAPLGPVYGAEIRRAFDERWIDIYPNKGKQSGAYSDGVYGVHSYVKMNFDGNYREVSTLAHELGHAMHSQFSNAAQPYALSHYPTFLAEIASTFNENLLMHHMLKAEKDDQLKLYLLDNYLEQLRGTLYRQTLFAEFELAMHERVEQGQTLTPDWLNQKYLELTRTYYGQDLCVVKVDDYIANEWSGIPHFFYDFYVFQYSTGIVASMALSDMVMNGHEAEQQKYLAFLKAGGSRFPLDTLRLAGVDMSTPKPVEASLKAFDALVTEMEQIYDRSQKK